VARWPYRFAHSHRRRRYGLDTLQAAVRELSVFFWGDFREEEFGVLSMPDKKIDKLAPSNNPSLSSVSRIDSPCPSREFFAA
jgi:hypothetical protein